jgi:hypothetical protein
MGSFFIWRWGNGIFVSTEREWNRMSEWKMAGKRNFVERELVLLELRFAAFEMGGPNQIDCIRAGGKEKNG